MIPRLLGQRCFLTPTVAALLLGITGLSAADALRERLSINADWRFQTNDAAEVAGALDYPKIRDWVLPSSLPFVKDPSALPKRPAGNLGAGVSFTQTAFDDTAWRKLDLPHDWAIEGPFKYEYPGETGKLKYWGPVWYRKHLALPAADLGKQLYLDVDGAMSYATVWCNGQFVGGWPYGYSSFRLDLTPYAKPGADNVLAIRLDSPDKFSRWYPGAGIYRNVWLVKTAPVHVGQWGSYITTPEVSAESATVAVKITVDNQGTTPAKAVVKTQVQFAGKPVADLPPQTVDLPAASSALTSANVTIPKPRLWDTVTPHRYTAVTTVEIAGAVVDRYETPFGIRTIAFTPDNGFLLNGKRVQLNGVCNHHDLGALGSAWNTRAAERQLEIMKEMGVNALRTSHNMPAPELLDLCDQMGILVMDESFDCWQQGKTGSDYGTIFNDWHEQDLRAVYRRDRNHPSVVMWSIGNEVNELGKKEEGPALAAHLTSIAHEEDPTRPTTLGSNNGAAAYNGVQKGVDVMGMNYENGDYAKFRTENPTIPLVGSETSSCISSRGEYFFQTPEQVEALNAAAAAEAAKKGKPAPKPRPFEVVSNDTSQGKSDFQMSSYDLYVPGWGWVPDAEFASLEKNSHVAGEFVWTGFDYLGEPTPYNGDTTNLLNFHDAEGKAKMEKELKELGKIRVPSRSSYFGIVDLAGFKKDRFFLYQAHWRPELPIAHLLPHWTWPERVGQTTPVHCYTSGDEAELFINGVSQGKKTKPRYEYRLRWDDVKYAPGEVKVVSYKQGKPWATEVMKTAGVAAKLDLTVDRPSITADRKDLAFVTVTVADNAGTLVPRSKNLIHFTVTGPGELVAVDNGDATSFDPFQASQVKAYNGLALAIIRAHGPGEITLQAHADGLTASSTVIRGK